MGALRITLTIIFIIICLALTVLVLMQEGKDEGLGAISGAAETYWGKNKGRSMELGSFCIRRRRSPVTERHED